MLKLLNPAVHLPYHSSPDPINTHDGNHSGYNKEPVDFVSFKAVAIQR